MFTISRGLTNKYPYIYFLILRYKRKSYIQLHACVYYIYEN